VTFDGAPVSLETLKERLADLKRRNSVVWYYRQVADREPPKEAMQVIELVAEHRLLVSMSTKPDYLDVVTPDGTTRPRDGALRPR
jgi:hypothetical protein